METIFFHHNELVICSQAEAQAMQSHAQGSYEFSSADQALKIIRQLQKQITPQRLLLYGSEPKAVLEQVTGLFKLREAAGGLVTNSKGELLIIRRFNTWDLPKGHREKNEPLAMTAIREVQEECGIQELMLQQFIATTYHYYTTAKHEVIKKTYWYNMFHPGNEQPRPQLAESITDALWAAPALQSEVAKTTYPSLRPLLANTHHLP